ncbi:hypothetical protein SH139x_002453 [Planctomycetaceae bacterium SH139]
MPRPKPTVNAHQFRVSGQAVGRLDYEDFSLRKHGTPESYACYHSLL